LRFITAEGPHQIFDIVRARRKILVIGLGNDERGDDAVGRVIARRLRGMEADNLRVVEASGEGAALLEAWKGSDFVILIDAMHSGARAGTIHRFNAHARQIPTRLLRTSTHLFGVADAIELARALGQLPARLIVYGIEGKTFEFGMGLSVEAQAASGKVIRRIRRAASLHC
jgi:hydrogenase maturation protease